MDQKTISSLLDAITAFGKEEWDAGLNGTPASAFHGRASVAQAVAAQLEARATRLEVEAATEEWEATLRRSEEEAYPPPNRAPGLLAEAESFRRLAEGFRACT